MSDATEQGWKKKKWRVEIARILVCVLALWLVLRGVRLDDRVVLIDGTELVGRIVAHEEGLSIERPDGAVQTVPAERIARNKKGGEEIHYGLRHVLANLRVGGFVWANVVFFPIVLILSLRLQWVLASQGVGLRYRDALSMTLAGAFLNFVALLGSYGGDVFKAYFVSLHTERKTEAVTAVALDRVIGLLGVLVIVTATVTFAPAESLLREFRPHVLGVLAVGAAGAAVYLSPITRRRVPTRLLKKLPYADHLRRVDETVVRLSRHKMLILNALTITVIRQLIAFASYVLVAKALGFRILAEDLVEYCAYFAIGVAVGAVPISPQGLGTVELAYVVFFKPFADVSQILCLALGIRLVHVITSLPGVVIAMTGAYRPPPRETLEVTPFDEPTPSPDETTHEGAALRNPASGAALGTTITANDDHPGGIMGA